MVTAIGFELVSRNVRMILDRSPQEEPLIPAEKTRIRLDLSRKKQRSEGINKGGYEYDYTSDSELVGEDQKELIEAKELNKAKKTYKETVERKPPEINLVAGIHSFTDASMINWMEEKEVEETVKVGRIWKIFDKSKRCSSSQKIAEHQGDVTRNKTSEIHSYENRDMINDIKEDFIIEDKLQEAQALNLGHSVPFKEDLTVNLSEGDAKELTINKSTPHSAKGEHQENVTKHSKERRVRAAEYAVISEQFLGKFRNLRRNMEDSNNALMKDSEKNVVVRSNRISKNIPCKNSSSISEENRLGTTPRLLPRQADATLSKDMKDSSERLALGSTTTRLSPRQVVACSNREDSPTLLPI